MRPVIEFLAFGLLITTTAVIRATVGIALSCSSPHGFPQRAVMNAPVENKSPADDRTLTLKSQVLTR